MKTNSIFCALVLLFQVLFVVSTYGDTEAATTRQPSPPAEHHQSLRSGKSGMFWQTLNVVKTLKKQAKNHKATGNEDTPQVLGSAIAGFVMSIFGLLAGISILIGGSVGLFIIGIILSILAIAISASAKKTIKRNPEKYSGYGFAVAGLTLGILTLAGLVLVFFVLILAFAGLFS